MTSDDERQEEEGRPSQQRQYLTKHQFNQERYGTFVSLEEAAGRLIVQQQALLPYLAGWREEEDDEEEDELLTSLLSRPLKQEEEETPVVLSPPPLPAPPPSEGVCPMGLAFSHAFVQSLKTLISPLVPPPPPPRSLCEEEQHETQIRALIALVESVEREKQTAYHDRNVTLSLVARLAMSIGLPVGLSRDVDGEEGFQISLFLELPSGQVSWHLPDDALSFFDDIGPYEGNWDGHTSIDKWERVLNPELARAVLFPAQVQTLPTLVPTEEERLSAAPTRRRQAVRAKKQEKKEVL